MSPSAPVGGRPWLLYALLGASLAMNLVMAIRWPRARLEVDAAVEAPPAPPAATDPGVDEPPPEEAAATVSPAPDAALAASGFRAVQGVVHENLSRTFQEALGDAGPAISAVFSRLFVWDLDVRTDLMKGDTLAALYAVSDSGEIDMPLAILHSQKLGKDLKACRFQAPGDAYASWWYPDGTEVPFRLQDGPIDDYIQITETLVDRKRHKGWDFKTPVGTPVKTPRAGKVVRENWSFRGNGNCLDIRFDDGTNAYFLHLSENLVKPGDRVAAGQVVAKSGNTGRSTAPHLHYQLVRGERVIDPGDYHGTLRRHLDPSTMPAFQAETARLDALLEAALALPPALPQTETSAPG